MTAMIQKTSAPRRVRGCKVLSVIVLALVSQFTRADSYIVDQWNPAWVKSRLTVTGHPAAVGSLSGVHIAIPREYLVFGVNYVDEHAVSPTLDTSISNFSLLLRLSNLEPRRTLEDEKEWESQMSSYEANFTRWWMSVDVRNGTWPDHGAGWLKTVVGRYLDAKNSGGDEYIDASDLEGLARKIAVRLAPAPSYETQHDLMYDKEQKTTLIICTHMRRNVEPHDVEVQCIQTFYLDDLHAMVSLNYDDMYLKNWKLYQLRVTDLLRSFVVH